jgi:heme/copper-type cytochrome/quinol oxidase subunit 1
MSDTVIEAPEYAERSTSYLTDGFTLRSWLLTTDHKRIAILYFGTITVFFFIGGGAAALLRYDLIAPEGMIGSAETYNRLFTLHGVVMVWFFSVPAVPVTLGNFLVPLMLGAPGNHSSFCRRRSTLAELPARLGQLGPDDAY